MGIKNKVKKKFTQHNYMVLKKKINELRRVSNMFTKSIISRMPPYLYSFQIKNIFFHLQREKVPPLHSVSVGETF
jgi:hypothetical protein